MGNVLPDKGTCQCSYPTTCPVSNPLQFLPALHITASPLERKQLLRTEKSCVHQAHGLTLRWDRSRKLHAGRSKFGTEALSLSLPCLCVLPAACRFIASELPPPGPGRAECLLLRWKLWLSPSSWEPLPDLKVSSSLDPGKGRHRRLPQGSLWCLYLGHAAKT